MGFPGDEVDRAINICGNLSLSSICWYDHALMKRDFMLFFYIF
jgi:hypothetical protein